MLDDWRPLLTIPANDVTASDVVSFSADGRSLLGITPIDANTSRLIRIDVTSGEIEVLAEIPRPTWTAWCCTPTPRSRRSSRC